MDPTTQLDAAGRRRSPATLPGYHSGRAPGKQGPQVPSRPSQGRGDRRRNAPSRRASCGPSRPRAHCRALARGPSRQRGPGAHRGRPRARTRRARSSAMAREAGDGKSGMDDGGWRQLDPWLKCRVQMPIGALFCVIKGTYGWTALVAGRGANAVSTPCQAGGRSPSLRPPRATSRSCSRDGTGRRSLERDPTPARTRGPRDHLGLPAGNRQRRDRRGRPRQAHSRDPSSRCARPIGGQETTRLAHVSTRRQQYLPT